MGYNDFNVNAHIVFFKYILKKNETISRWISHNFFNVSVFLRLWDFRESFYLEVSGMMLSGHNR